MSKKRQEPNVFILILLGASIFCSGTLFTYATYVETEHLSTVFYTTLSWTMLFFGLFGLIGYVEELFQQQTEKNCKNG